MNVTKYSDLSQSLAESEKELYDKISEECASNFEIAIMDSIKKINENAETMSRIVDTVQSCEDSYGETAKVIGKLSGTVSDTDKKATEVNEELDKLIAQTVSATNGLTEQIEKLLESSGEIISASKDNETIIETASENIQLLEKKYSDSINGVISNIDQLQAKLDNSEDKISDCVKSIALEADSFSEKNRTSLQVIEHVLSEFTTLQQILETFKGLMLESQEKGEVVSNNLQEAGKNITDIHNELVKINGEIKECSSTAKDEIGKHIDIIKQETDDIESQTEKFAGYISESIKQIDCIIDAQHRWEESCDLMLQRTLDSVEKLTTSYTDNADSISNMTNIVHDKEIAIVSELEESSNNIINQNFEYVQKIKSCAEDVEKCTAAFVKSIKDVNISILDSFEKLKDEIIIANEAHTALIEELKLEQLKQKKMLLFGMIPIGIIIALQIISIIV